MLWTHWTTGARDTSGYYTSGGYRVYGVSHLQGPEVNSTLLSINGLKRAVTGPSIVHCKDESLLNVVF